MAIDELLKQQEELSPRDRMKKILAEKKKPSAIDTLLSTVKEKEGEPEALGSEQEEDGSAISALLKQGKAKEEEGPGFLEGVVRGFREEVAPFSYSKEEIERRKAEPTTFAGTAGEVVGGITTSIAATAAAAKVGAVTGAALAGPGAPLGAVLGAGVAAVGYALYSGFGQEQLQASITDQETSTARALARSALSINPAARVTGEVASKLAVAAPRIAKLAAKAGTKTQVARAAAQVAGETAVAGSTYGEEGALAAGAASLILSPFVFARAKGAPTPKEVEAFTEFAESDEGIELIARKADELSEIQNLEVSRKNLEEESFLNYVLNQPNMPGSGGRVFDMSYNDKKKALKKMTALDYMTPEGKLIRKGGLTKDSLIEMYKGHKAQKILLEGVKEANVEQAKRIAEAASKGAKAPPTDAFSSIESWILDGQYIGRAIDRVAGTNYTSQLNSLAETGNKFEVVKVALQKRILSAQKEEKKLVKVFDKRLGSTYEQVSENLSRLRIFISENDERFLTPELKKYVDLEARTIKVDTPEGQQLQRAMEKWDNVFETARAGINSNSEYYISKVDNYQTRRTLANADLVTSIRRSMQSLKAIATPAGVDDILKLDEKALAKVGIKGDEAQEILYEVESLSFMARTRLNMDKAEVSEANLGKLIKDLTNNGKARLGLGSELSAIIQRGEASIAPRFRMLNMTDVAMTYVNGNLRNAMFNKNYRELSDSLEVIRRLGMTNAADWMQDHLDDMVGGLSKGNAKVSNLLLSSVDRYKIEVNRLFDKTDFKGDEFLRKAALYIPDMLGKTRSMIYPSYLALNVRAHLRDYGQVLLKAAPELGGWQGYKTAFKAYAETLRYGRGADGRFSFKVLKQKLQNAGVSGEYDITAEAVRAERPAAGKLTSAYRETSEKLMTIYSFGDFINRAVTYNMGRVLARDIVNGDEAALKSLGNLGRAAKTNLEAAGFREAVEAGDVEQIGGILGKWLVPKTQFYYGPEQKARFARFMGPTFSMFTKWPTSIGSELIDIWKENPGAYRKMKRYADIHMVPLALLSSIDYVNEEYFDGDEAGAYRYLVGSAKEMAPAFSLEFTLFNNPTLELADAAVSAAKTIELTKPETAAKAAATFTKKAAKQTLGPISAVMNEIERFQTRAGGAKETDVDELFNNIFGAE